MRTPEPTHIPNTQVLYLFRSEHTQAGRRTAPQASPAAPVAAAPMPPSGLDAPKGRPLESPASTARAQMTHCTMKTQTCASNMIKQTYSNRKQSILLEYTRIRHTYFRYSSIYIYIYEVSPVPSQCLNVGMLVQLLPWHLTRLSLVAEPMDSWCSHFGCFESDLHFAGFLLHHVLCCGL